MRNDTQSDLAHIESKMDDHTDGFFADEVELPNAKKPSISPIPVIPELGMALGLLIFVFGVTYISLPGTVVKQSDSDTIVETQIQPTASTQTASLDAFDDARVRAQGAVVWDVKNQRMLFNKNGDDVLPLASVTKLMTALVAYELLDTNERITITQKALRTDGDSGFTEGEAFELQDLLDLTLISSSNDGASALGATVGNAIDSEHDAGAVFVKAMNIKAEEIGLTQTFFKNSTGLDISETEAGAEGSARDMALLMEYIILNAPDVMALTTEEETTIYNESGDSHRTKNTNNVVAMIDGLIGSKTGYTTLAGGNLVTAFNAGLNRPIIIAVLGSTYQSRFDDTLELVERTHTYLNAE